MYSIFLVTSSVDHSSNDISHKEQPIGRVKYTNIAKAFAGTFANLNKWWNFVNVLIYIAMKYWNIIWRYLVIFSYIIFLRITPFLPNWFINVVSPIISVPLTPFYLGTLIGVAPPSFICIQAGTTLQQLTSRYVLQILNWMCIRFKCNSIFNWYFQYK